MTIHKLLWRLGLIRRFRVTNERTGEWLDVYGPSARGCRHVADRECSRLGWGVGDMRSEEVER